MVGGGPRILTQKQEADRKETARCRENLAKATAQVEKEKADSERYYQQQGQKRRKSLEERYAHPQPVDSTMLKSLMSWSMDQKHSPDEVMRYSKRGTMWPAITNQLAHPTAISQDWFPSGVRQLLILLEWDLKSFEGEDRATRRSQLEELVQQLGKQFNLDRGDRVSVALLPFFLAAFAEFPECKDVLAKAINESNLKRDMFILDPSLPESLLSWHDDDDQIDVSVPSNISVTLLSVRGSFGVIGADNDKLSVYAYISPEANDHPKNRYAKLPSIKHNCNPTWHQEVPLGPADSPAYIYFWDDFAFALDRYMGCIKIDISQVSKIMLTKKKSTLTFYQSMPIHENYFGNVWFTLKCSL